MLYNVEDRQNVQDVRCAMCGSESVEYAGSQRLDTTGMIWAGCSDCDRMFPVGLLYRGVAFGP
jgi:hypothetical protein